MKNLSIFQLVLLGLFVFFIMGGMVAVAIYSSSSKAGGGRQLVNLTIWGTVDQALVTNLIDTTPELSLGNIKVTYYQKAPSDLTIQLLEAITNGQSPDILLLNSDRMISLGNKIMLVSSQDYPARTYKDTFIQEAELFLGPTGTIAIPFSVDPLVMYWNRDIFTAAGLNTPPKYWDELYYLSKQLTKRDTFGTIIQSAAALGGYDNIAHAKDILANLFLQTGNSITVWNSAYTSISSVLNAQNIGTPAESVVAFYTQFANTVSPVYTWNGSLPDSKAMFISNRLAIYFGLASEFLEIRAKNPNLNFDVALMPQFKDSPTPAVLGELYGLVLLRNSANYPMALGAVKIFTSPAVVTRWVGLSALPPVRKDVVIPPANPYMTIFNNSAVIAKGWIDPNGPASDTIFRNMINSVVSGYSLPATAVNNANAQLIQLISQ